MNETPTMTHINYAEALFNKPGIHIEALRGRQGDRQMFLLLVTNHVLLRNFAAEAEVTDHGQAVQRTLDKRHYKDIVEYITENPADYILGAMTYATDLVGDEEFVPMRPGSNIGTLVLPMDARLRCLDGQHRRAAIAEAVIEDEEVGDDFSAVVVLYVEDDYSKRRQMFSDMNATPKVVSKALNITFDSRDPYAQAAQRLAAEHDLLRGVVETTKARINANDPNIFSLSGVYDGLKRYDLGMVLPRGRSPKAKSVEELVSLGTELFNLVGSARPEFKDVKDAIANADPKDLGETMRGKAKVHASAVHDHTACDRRSAQRSHEGGWRNRRVPVQRSSRDDRFQTGLGSVQRRRRELRRE